jgi:small subunit ribosomal protein S21
VIKISVREDESLESVLKRFKRICDKEGIKKALKQYSYYEKPSDKKRRKEKERIRNIRKQNKAKAKVKAKPKPGAPGAPGAGPGGPGGPRPPFGGGFGGPRS